LLKTKKSLGQHFLKDKNICNKIVNISNLYNKTIIEIGPGKGILTNFIINKKPKNLILIEKDYELYKFLLKQYENNTNISIFNDDALTFEYLKYKNIILISNLPYNISTKLIIKLFKLNNNINELIFMVQKEVADKFNYKLGKVNKYKFMAYLSSIMKIHFDVSPNVFYPKPKVLSSVVSFKLNSKKKNWTIIENFIDKIFKNKRKKIHNNLAISKRINKVSSNKRVEELEYNEILELYKFFQS